MKRYENGAGKRRSERRFSSGPTSSRVFSRVRRTKSSSERSWRRYLNFSIGVIHYPVYDKHGNTVATSVTNLEIHDIARTCMTFGIDLCYIVTPLAKQREIAEKLIHHWIHGYGSTYNPARGEALRKVRLVSTVQEMIDHVGQKGVPLVVGTSSRERPRQSHDLSGTEQVYGAGNEACPCAFRDRMGTCR